MDIRNFKQFKTAGAKLGRNTIGISSYYGFTFSAGFYHRAELKNFKYVVFFFNEEKEGNIAFAFTNDEKTEGKFTITHTERKTSGSTTARSFFFSYNLDKRIKKISGKYTPKEISHPVFGRIYYISLDEKIN